MTSIYDLSWKETSFLAKLQLFFKAREEFKTRKLTMSKYQAAESYSALSSTYYSIVGTAVSQHKKAPRSSWISLLRLGWWSITWFPLAMFCYWRMLPLSNRVVQLVGYDEMTVGQCDIRQSILRKRSQLEEARECIRNAWGKNFRSAHIESLLYAGLADIEAREEKFLMAEVALSHAIYWGKKAEEEEPAQAARIYRGCANVMRYMVKKGWILAQNLTSIEELGERARALNLKSGAKDQLLKSQAS